MEDDDGDGRYGARCLDENKRTFLEFSFDSNFILCRSCSLSLVISLHLMSPSLFAFSFFKSACFWQSLNFLDNSLLSTALFFCHSMHAFSQFYGTILPLSWFILHSFIYFVFFFAISLHNNWPEFFDGAHITLHWKLSSIVIWRFLKAGFVSILFILLLPFFNLPPVLLLSNLKNPCRYSFVSILLLHTQLDEVVECSSSVRLSSSSHGFYVRIFKWIDYLYAFDEARTLL